MVRFGSPDLRTSALGMKRVRRDARHPGKKAILATLLKDVGGGTMRRTGSQSGQMICIWVSALQELLRPLRHLYRPWSISNVDQPPPPAPSEPNANGLRRVGGTGMSWSGRQFPASGPRRSATDRRRVSSWFTGRAEQGGEGTSWTEERP